MADAENPTTSPEQEQEKADSVMETTVNALRELKSAITPSDENFQKAAEAVTRAKDYIDDASEQAQRTLEVELELLGPTLDNLTPEIQKSAKTNIKTLREGITTIFEKLKNGAKSGFEKVVDTLATTAETVGNFMNTMWERFKPQLSRIAETPGIAFLLGEKNLSALQGWLGYNGEMVQLQQDIRDRIPNDVLFNITDKKELIAFNDIYDQMLRKKNETPTKYSKGAFFNEILGTHLKVETLQDTNNDQKKDLVMTQIITAGRKLLDETIQVTTATPAVAATPAAPSTAPITPK